MQLLSEMREVNRTAICNEICPVGQMKYAYANEMLTHEMSLGIIPRLVFCRIGICVKMIGKPTAPPVILERSEGSEAEMRETTIVRIPSL